MMLRRLRRMVGLKSPPVVSVLRLSGVIGSFGGFRPGLSMQHIAALIERAFAPEDQAAVALVINSPGGSPAQSALMANRIRSFAAEKKVPVLAFVEDVAASGGYWLACAADEIIAESSSIVGSIGVISQGFGFQEAIARLGIERRLYTAGERKSLLDPFRPESPEDVARLRDLQDELHRQFMDWVRTRRAGKLQGDETALFSGEFWTGRRALELGLIDGLGDIRSVARARFGDTVQFRPIAEHGSWFARRLGLAGAGVPMDDPMGTIGAPLAAGLVAAVEERALWARYGL